MRSTSRGCKQASSGFCTSSQASGGCAPPWGTPCTACTACTASSGSPTTLALQQCSMLPLTRSPAAFQLHLFLTFKKKKLAQRTLGWGARGVQTTQGMFKSIDAKVWPPASEEMQRLNRTARLTLVAWSKFCSYAWNRFSVAVLCQFTYNNDLYFESKIMLVFFGLLEKKHY